ncbi:MAG: hypothetical protein IJ567_06420 [Lachnospiraceae bacterium]|nr:hypothetical protein [Lachnospiraceae bacterium]
MSKTPKIQKELTAEERNIQQKLRAYFSPQMLREWRTMNQKYGHVAATSKTTK